MQVGSGGKNWLTNVLFCRPRQVVQYIKVAEFAATFKWSRVG